MSVPLHELVYGWHTRRATGTALWAELRRLVQRLSAPFPEAWFEGGVRDAAAIDSLTSRVFLRCDRRPVRAPPFAARTPFRAYTEDRMSSGTIRYYTVYGRLSVARDEMKRDYRKSVRRDPALAWRDQLYRALAAALPEIAQRASGDDARWVTREPGPRRVRSDEEVGRELLRRDLPWEAVRALEPAAVSALAQEALRLLSRPITTSALTHLLADTVRAPLSARVEIEGGPDVLPTHRRPDADIALREALIAGWSALEPLDRAIAAGLARGESPDAILAADPRINSRPTLVRALARISAVLLAPVLDDVRVFGEPELKPQRRVEVLMEALLDLLPELP